MANFSTVVYLAKCSMVYNRIINHSNSLSFFLHTQVQYIILSLFERFPMPGNRREFLYSFIFCCFKQAAHARIPSTFIFSHLWITVFCMKRRNISRQNSDIFSWRCSFFFFYSFDLSIIQRKSCHFSFLRPRFPFPILCIIFRKNNNLILIVLFNLTFSFFLLLLSLSSLHRRLYKLGRCLANSRYSLCSSSSFSLSSSLIKQIRSYIFNIYILYTYEILSKLSAGTFAARFVWLLLLLNAKYWALKRKLCTY